MKLFESIPPEKIKWVFIIAFVVISVIYLTISIKSSESYASTDESLIDQICKQKDYQLDCSSASDLSKAVDICKLQRSSYAGCKSTDPEVLAQACPIQCDISLSTFSKEDASMYEGYSIESNQKPTIITNTLNLNENAVLQSDNPFKQDTYASNPVISIRKSNRGI